MESQEGARARQLARLLAGLDQTFREDFKRSSRIPQQLTLAQYQVLSMVTEGGTCSQKTIADNLRVTGPTVVRIIDALEKKKLVSRVRDVRDRRIVLVSLTEQGALVQHECAALQEQRLVTMMGRLPTNTAESLLQSLAALLTAAHPVRPAEIALPALPEPVAL